MDEQNIGDTIPLIFPIIHLSGETKAIENVSFDVYENEFLGIIGPSGSGKSTILSLIFGLLTPTSGQIHMAESFLISADETPIGYMLQKDHLFRMALHLPKYYP